MPDVLKYKLQMVFGAFCIGFAPIFATLADIEAGGWIAFYRLSLSAIIFFVWLLFLGKYRISKKKIVMYLIVGAVFGIDMIFWHQAILDAGAGISTILANTQVFYLMLLGHFFDKDRMGLKNILSFILVMIGLKFLVGGLTLEGYPHYFRGVIFALIGGVAYAIFTFLLSRKGRGEGISSLLILFVIVCGSSGVISGVVQYSIDGAFYVPEGEQWLWLISIAVVCQVIGWVVISTNLTKIPVASSGLILLIQPITAFIMGAILFNEPINASKLLGAVITLGAIFYGSQIIQIKRSS